MLCGLSSLATAEKADAYKPTRIDYGSLDFDQVKGVYVLTGNVVLTRGTLSVEAGKALVGYTPEGYQQVTLTGEGKKVTLRQRRDGPGDQWLEAEAERVEYDEKSGMVKLFSQARMRRLLSSRLSEEVEGEFISYDSRRELFSVRNSKDGVDRPGGGRGMIVLQPRRRELPLSPETAVSQAR